MRFDEPLDSPDVAILVWQGGDLRRLAIPKLGDVLDVPWSAGPSGMF